MRQLRAPHALADHDALAIARAAVALGHPQVPDADIRGPTGRRRGHR